MTHLGPDTWLLDNRAYDATDSLAVALGYQGVFSTELNTPNESLRVPVGWGAWRAWPQDVVIPPPSPRDWSLDWRGPGGRGILFAWLGKNNSKIRHYMLESWHGPRGRDRGVLVDHGGWDNYTIVMQHARWCGVPDGSVPWTWRFLDALHCGCVPVVISDRWHPPFARLIRWTAPEAPVLFLRPQRIPELAHVLASYPRAAWRQKQAATIRLAALIDPRSRNFHEAWMGELMLGHSRP